MATPATAHNRHIGTTRITAIGIDQLSYWAASTRNTSTTAPANAMTGFWKIAQGLRPARQLLHISQLGPFDAMRSASCCLASASTSEITVPVLTPGSDPPLTVAAGYML